MSHKGIFKQVKLETDKPVISQASSAVESKQVSVISDLMCHATWSVIDTVGQVTKTQ